jgi:hypothetical protein
MSMSAHERRAHFRGRSNPGQLLNLRIASSADAPQQRRWNAVHALDIGTGGAFLTSSAHAVGQEIVLELQLPTSEQRFLLPAVVRWVGTRAIDEVAGVGVQFLNVEVEVLLALNEFLQTI